MKIGISAQSFGFGPASKIAMIAQVLKKTQGIETVIFANGIANEFFVREKLGNQPDMYPYANYLGKENLASLANKIDAVIVGLDPEWVTFFSGKCPIFFVDSLGFMWGKDFYETFPELLRVEKYFVQDLFGAHERLKNFGINNLVSIGGIIDTGQQSPNQFSTTAVNQITVHLGGLLNTIDESSTSAYFSYFLKLLDFLDLKIDVVLLSAVARNSLNLNRKTIFKTISHFNTIEKFKTSRTVFTSPGLTTLLELAALRIPVIPLPPQNMSQAIIVNKIADSIQNAPNIWHILANEYGNLVGLPEKDGVLKVKKKNAELATSKDFFITYKKEVFRCLEEPWLIPTNIVKDFCGLSECCRQIIKSIN